MRAFLLTLILTALTATGAQADLGYKFGVFDNGVGYAAVKGRFEINDDLSRFEALVRRNKPSVIIFNSPGGNPHKAMEMGILIRRNGLSTLQDRTVTCASACALAFMGGTTRTAESGSIGMHKSSFSQGAAISASHAVSSIQETTALMIAYLEKMGVSPGVMSLALSTDAHRMRYLTAAEMAHYKVTTKAPDVGTHGIQARQTNPRPAPMLGYAPTERRNAAAGSAAGWPRTEAFGGSFIQIKSFRTRAEADGFVASFAIPSAVHPATNGWFAVTLRQTYPRDEAVRLSTLLKRDGAIPSDSFVTPGENYVR
jgi:hypothetical protein